MTAALQFVIASCVEQHSKTLNHFPKIKKGLCLPQNCILVRVQKPLQQHSGYDWTLKLLTESQTNIMLLGLFAVS